MPGASDIRVPGPVEGGGSGKTIRAANLRPSPHYTHLGYTGSIISYAWWLTRHHHGVALRARGAAVRFDTRGEHSSAALVLVRQPITRGTQDYSVKLVHWERPHTNRAHDGSRTRCTSANCRERQHAARPGCARRKAARPPQSPGGLSGCGTAPARAPRSMGSCTSERSGSFMSARALQGAHHGPPPT